MESSLKVERREGGPRWSIRPMRHADIDKCLVIWSQVELTEAKQTVASVLTADPEGFYVAELDETGDVIGMCAGPTTRSDTAFMGFYAVNPQYQRMGIGRELWSKTMQRLSELNVGLYGVPSMSAKYKKSGFMVEDSTRMLVYESQPFAEDKLSLDELVHVDELIGCRLIRVDGSSNERTFRKMVDYDESVQKFNRHKLLHIYLTGQDAPLTVALVKKPNNQQSGNYVVGAAGGAASGERKSSCCVKSTTGETSSTGSTGIDEQEESSSSSSKSKSNLPAVSSNSLGDLRRPVDDDLVEVDSTTPSASSLSAGSSHDLRQDEKILGYGTIRLDNNDGGIIGPIYADSNEVCEVLLRYLMSEFHLERGHIFSAMALTSNQQACRILEKVGLKEMEQCSRMFTKFVPEADFSKVFYVHSPNFTLF